MAQTVRVKAEALQWARRSCRLSPKKAADLLKVGVEDLTTWERDGHDFRLTELREIARKYKRPIVALVRSDFPPVPEPPEDFRTFAGRPPEMTMLTTVAIRDARRIQGIASTIIEQDRTLFPPTTLPQADWRSDSPPEIALDERRSLGISRAEQFRWLSANEAFNAWRARIQLRGIITLVKPMDPKDCRGFSLYEPKRIPIIVANQREIDEAKIFTLAHEYAHLMLRRGGLCLEEGGTGTDRQRIEAWCNAFAGTMLAPEHEVRTYAERRHIDGVLVHTLAHRFKVSKAVIAIRLQNIGLVDAQFVQQFVDVQADWKQKPPPVPEEVSDQEDLDEGFGRRQEEVRLSEVGFAYPKIILGALRHELLTIKEASEFLNVRADAFEPLEARVRAIEAKHS